MIPAQLLIQSFHSSLGKNLCLPGVSDYLSDNNLVTQCQSGFTKHFSTTTTLLKFSYDAFSSFDDILCTVAIFLDFSKVFNLVDHYLLLDKLHAIGLSR